MRPTSGRALLVAGALAAVVGFVLPVLFYGSLPVLPWTGPGALAVAAVAGLGVAVVLQGRLAGGRDAAGTPIRPVEPMAVARWAALARASSLGGALAAGGYTGYGIYTSFRLGHARRRGARHDRGRRGARGCGAARPGRAAAGVGLPGAPPVRRRPPRSRLSRGGDACALLPSPPVTAPADDDLEQLSTEELREQAFAKAQDAKDVGFFWDLLKHSKGAAGVGTEDASSGAILETIAEGVAAVRQTFGHRDGDLDPMLRARYLEYLREPRG